jgi:hypothetical protein
VARRGRKSYFAPTITRTIERVGIAALATIATSSGNAGIIGTAIIVFCIVAVVEELGRGFILRGRRVGFWDVARERDRARRLRSVGNRKRNRKRNSRPGSREGDSDPISGEGDEGGGEVLL